MGRRFTVGKNTRLVLGSFHTLLSMERVPEMTSSSPIVAFGASALDKDGFLRSQSIRITLLPVPAMSWAKETAIVDLPSLGKDEVIPMTLFEVCPVLNSMPNLMDRTDSANRDNGMLITPQCDVEAVERVLLAPEWGDSFALTVLRFAACNRGTTDRQGKPNAASIWPGVRNTRSIVSLSKPSPVPRPIPPNSASASTRMVLGLLFLSGGNAG